MNSREIKFTRIANFETHRPDDAGIVRFDVESGQTDEAETAYNIAPPFAAGLPDDTENHMTIKAVKPDVLEIRAQDKLVTDSIVAALAHAALAEAAQEQIPPAVFAIKDIMHERDLLASQELVRRYDETLGMELVAMTRQGEAIFLGNARKTVDYAADTLHENGIVRSRYLPAQSGQEQT